MSDSGTDKQAEAEPQGVSAQLSALADEIEEQFAESKRLARASDQSHSGRILEHTLDRLWEIFADALPFERMGFALLEDDARIVRARWGRSEAGEIKLARGYVAPVHGGSLDAVLESGEPRILGDLESYLEDHPDSDTTRLMIEEGMLSSLTCPLTAVSRPIGFLFFSSTEKETYTDEHAELFGKAAAQVAVLLEKSRLYDDLVDLSWQLGVTRDALEYQASHDSLTGLWSRSAILDITAKEIERARREEVPLTVVMVDLDHFKKINDDHGHPAGDAVLQEVGERLRDGLRSYETVGRYGGEEFLMTLYSCDGAGAEKATERLRAAIEAEPVVAEGREIPVTVSIGAAVCEDLTDDHDSDAFIKSADAALYAAKDKGRNRCVVVTVDS